MARVFDVVAAFYFVVVAVSGVTGISVGVGVGVWCCCWCWLACIAIIINVADTKFAFASFGV